MEEIKLGGMDALRVPPKVKDQPAHQVVLFHGYGASQSDLAGLSQVLLKDKNIEWFFPNGLEALQFNGMEMGRCWFDLQVSSLQEALANDDYDYIEKQVYTKLDPCLGQVEKMFDPDVINYEQAVVGGFSQGSILSFSLALRQSRRGKVPKAICLFSPTFIGEAKLIEEIKELGDVPLFISHGTEDQVLPFRQTAKLVELCEKHFKNFCFHQFDDGHTIPLSAIQHAQDFLSDYL